MESSEEFESAIDALATTLASATLVKQPTKSKKRRERLRLKQLRKKLDELQAKTGEGHEEVAIAEAEKPFPFLKLPTGTKLLLRNR